LDQIKITKIHNNIKPVVNIYSQIETEKKAADANKKLLDQIAQKAKEDQAIAAQKKADLNKRSEALKEEVKNTVFKYNTEDKANKKIEDDFKKKLAEIKKREAAENKKLEEDSRKKLAEIEKTREEFN